MNQHQLTMTRGDSRTFDFSDVTEPDGTAYDLNLVTGMVFRVDGLFQKTISDFDIDESAGDILVDVSPGDTEDAGDHPYRRAYPYELEFTITGVGVRTVRAGLFVLKRDLAEVE
jgi:hypothetical protein